MVAVLLTVAACDSTSRSGPVAGHESPRSNPTPTASQPIAALASMSVSPAHAHAGEVVTLRGRTCPDAQIYWHDSRNLQTRGPAVLVPLVGTGGNYVARYAVQPRDNLGKGLFVLTCYPTPNAVANLVVTVK